MSEQESSQRKSASQDRKFRLLLTGVQSAARNMAIDESVLHHVSNGESIPTLRFYQWSPPAVSIGYFQSMEDEIDVERCKRTRVDFVRRITGGGAVFHDKEFTYSLIVPEKYVSADILESYHQICYAIIYGLKMMGLNAEFAPLNDITLDGRKISGNAQTRKKGCVLQHGTLLMEVDVQRMFSILKVPDEKIRDKLLSDVKERVTGINTVIGQQVDFNELTQVMATGFQKALNITLEEDVMSLNEEEMEDQLFRDKYTNDEWNFKR